MKLRFFSGNYFDYSAHYLWMYQSSNNNSSSAQSQQPSSALLASDSGIHKIKHIAVIMQENRAFDSYFGTYPGVDGIPMKNGIPTVSVFDPATGKYVMPYHDIKVL